MIGGVSPYSNAYALYAASAARRQQPAEQSFSVPASALRSEATKAAQYVQPAQTAADPAADPVAFSRDFPQLLMNQAYAPPPIQQVQATAGRIQDASATAASAQRAAEGGRSTPGLGQEMDDSAQGGAGTGIPGDPGQMNANGEKPAGAEGSEDSENAEGSEGGDKKANGEEMDRGEQAQVTELKQRDREVRAHEQAHQAVGGAYAGGASYEFQQGPDGQRYAVGGEVSIDMSAERDPQATIAKMQQVKAAAMAPAEPSGQDRSVAASATATEMQARAEMSSASAEEASGETGEAAEAGEAAGGAEGQTGENQSAGIGGAAGVSGQSDSGNGAMSINNAEPTGMSSSLFRANPYSTSNSESTPGVLNLPEAYRAIDVVA